MKIVLVSSSYHPYYRGGGEHSVKALAENLLKLDQQVRVITAFEKNQTDKVNGVTVHRVRHPNIYWSYHSSEKSTTQKLVWHIRESYNPRVAAAVTPILTDYQPDVLHVRNVEDLSPYVCRVAHRLNIPVVVTLNSYTWLCPKATMYRQGHNCAGQCLDCKILTYPKRYLSRYVNAVVGVSQFMVDRHRHYGYFPHAQASAIYTSVPAQPLPLPARQNNYVTLGYIGRIHPTKGVNQIVKAFKKLPPPHRLLLAGDGPEAYVQQCRLLAKNSERIVFLGPQPAADFYRQVDGVVINSLWNEPFPRVLAEAYAFGRPVIAACTGGTPEQVVTGRTGYIFDPQRPLQLTDQMQTFTSLSREQLNHMQAQVISFHQNIPQEAPRYLHLYQSLIQ